MNVFGLQYDIAWKNRERNFETVAQMTAEAKPAPDDLVILPEMFSTGFSMDSQRVSEEPEGESFRFASSLAKQYRIYTIAGWPVKNDEGYFNQAVVLDPDGLEIARYSKIHSFSLAGESENYRDGNSLCMFDAGGMKIALAICYDLRFPELFREYVRQGATMFVVIANWPSSREYHWRTLLCARAIENQAYVVGVNRIGTDPNVMDGYNGSSMIIDPRGRILDQADTNQEVIKADVSPAAVERWRKAFPAVSDIKGSFDI